MFVSLFKPEPLLPGRMSLKIVVPAAVPLLDHSSLPLVPSSARKKRIPLMFVSSNKLAPFMPGRMSLTIVVPARVPSVFHSSFPRWGVVATKNVIPFTSVN